MIELKNKLNMNELNLELKSKKMKYEKQKKLLKVSAIVFGLTIYILLAIILFGLICVLKELKVLMILESMSVFNMLYLSLLFSLAIFIYQDLIYDVTRNILHKIYLKRNISFVSFNELQEITAKIKLEEFFSQMINANHTVIDTSMDWQQCESYVTCDLKCKYEDVTTGKVYIASFDYDFPLNKVEYTKKIGMPVIDVQSMNVVLPHVLLTM